MKHSKVAEDMAVSDKPLFEEEQMPMTSTSQNVQIQLVAMSASYCGAQTHLEPYNFISYSMRAQTLSSQRQTPMSLILLFTGLRPLTSVINI